MGWIRKTATSVPLKSLKRIVARQQSRKPKITLVGVMLPMPWSTLTNTAPEIAPTAPTEISCPPQAAVTSVMPMAMMASSLALSMMLMRLPVRTMFPEGEETR